MDTTDKAIATVLLFELVDSDDEKSKKGKTRDWVKRRRQGEMGILPILLKSVR